jgi:transcription elongation GreA/GreB family factor
MSTDFASVLSSIELPPGFSEKLQRLTPGNYCRHKSWGFGLIKEWGPTGQMTIDFEGKKGHLMQFQYAAETLTPLPPDDICVQKAANPEALRVKARENPLQVVRECIESLRDQATAEGIAAVLCPDIIPHTEWKKWWESAKRAMKKDGHFHISQKKTQPLRMLAAPQALGQEALENFRQALGAKGLLNALVAVERNWSDIKSESVAREIVAAINESISKLSRSQRALAIELALARDEFLETAGLSSQVQEPTVISFVPPGALELSEILESLPSVKQTRLLQVISAQMPEAWSALFINLLPRASGRVAMEITETFIAADRAPEIVRAINKLLRERTVTCDMLHWLCKNRQDIFAPLFEPSLFNAILSVLERDQLSDIKRGTKLYELVLTDKALIQYILRDALPEDVRDITRAILLSPVFEELDKRSLLAAIIKLYPDVQSMVVGEKSTEDNTLIVSWESLERRKAELEEIVNKKIPENSKEIGIARSYGDLRENHEFKAAKEMQAVLMRRKAELESMLMRAQGTDFSNADTSVVNIGTRVTVQDKDGGQSTAYSILGAWDSDPASGVISYLTPVAQALFKQPVGKTVEIPLEDNRKRVVTITKIEPYKK